MHPPTGEILAQLRLSPLFSQCSDSALQELQRRLRTRHFRRGEVIFHQGDPGDALHVVASGAVKIVLPSPEGDEAIIATLGRGDFLASWRCSTELRTRPRPPRSRAPRR